MAPLQKKGLKEVSLSYTLPPMNPISFKPIYMERVWGGRMLEACYGRELPSDQPFGESWEISDRQDEQSVVSSGPFKGKTINQLWNDHREEIFGDDMPECERFPLLIKILDARSDLSIQVHPPADLAESYGGEPKTEMWYIADTTPDAKLYVGVKKGVSKESFKENIDSGTVEQAVHAITPKNGESILLKSGRLHAIGAGFLIYEIQQSSDTTFRVFDWNRLGLDGKPRQLHIEESMACIDFSDFEPSMDSPKGDTITQCDYFHVNERNFGNDQKVTSVNPNTFSILTVVEGSLKDSEGTHYKAGDFFLLPRLANPLTSVGKVKILETTLP